MTIFLVASLQARLLYAKRPKKSRQEPCFLAVCGCAGANAGDGRCAAGRPQGSPLRRNTSGLRCRGGYQPPAVIPCPGFRVDQGIDTYGVQRASSSVGEGLAPPGSSADKVRICPGAIAETQVVPPGDREGRPYGETRQWCIAGDGGRLIAAPTAFRGALCRRRAR